MGCQRCSGSPKPQDYSLRRQHLSWHDQLRHGTGRECCHADRRQAGTQGAYSTPHFDQEQCLCWTSRLVTLWLSGLFGCLCGPGSLECNFNSRATSLRLQTPAGFMSIPALVQPVLQGCHSHITGRTPLTLTGSAPVSVPRSYQGLSRPRADCAAQAPAGRQRRLQGLCCQARSDQKGAPG